MNERTGCTQLPLGLTSRKSKNNFRGEGFFCAGGFYMIQMQLRVRAKPVPPTYHPLTKDLGTVVGLGCLPSSGFQGAASKGCAWGGWWLLRATSVLRPASHTAECFFHC